MSLLINAWKEISNSKIDIAIGKKSDFDATLILWPDSILEKCLTSFSYRLLRSLRPLGRIGLTRYYLELLVERECRNIRRIKGPVYWQIHELAGHHIPIEIQYLDRKIRQEIIYKSEALFITEESTRIPIQDYFDTNGKEMFVSHLGGYRDFYKDDTDLNATRMKLGIPLSKTAILIFGRARKNTDFTSIFKKLTDNGYFVVLAGQGYKTLNLDETNCLNISKFIQKDDVAQLLSSVDYVIKPESEYLNSGVLRLAISYQKPVIAHSFGATRDLASNCLVDLSETDWLSRISTRESNEYKDMVEAAKLRDQERDWNSAAQVMHDKIIEYWETKSK